MTLHWGKPTYLDAPWDIAWCRATACADMPVNIRTVVLYGNEDSPTQVEGWFALNPDHQAKPDYTWSRPEEAP